MIALCVVSFSLSGCYAVVGNRDEATETRTVNAFTAVDGDHGVHVRMIVDPEHNGDVDLEVTAESNLLSHIETDVIAQTLVIDVDGAIVNHQPLEVEAVVQDLSFAAANNGAEVIVEDLDRAFLDVDSNNGAEVIALGFVDELSVTTNNGADVDARDLSATIVDVDVDNGSKAVVCATDQVTGIVNNGAKLVVKCGGDASRVDTKNGGSID